MIKTTYTYDPFGNVTISGESSDNPFQYTGRENDGTGLYYYRFRYYSPELQRFISEDPIGLKGGINKFAYVGNSPTNFVDKLGLEKEKDPCKCAPFWTREPCKFLYNLDFIDCGAQYPYNEELRKKCEDEARERLKKCCETGEYPWKYK